jgi:Spy/CpxP family protein refolding chaperone
MRNLILAAVVATVSVSTLPAQEPQVSKAAQQTNQLAIDRWIAEPTPLTLTPDQRVAFDSVRARYRADLKAVNGAGAVDDVGLVMRMHELDTKYQKLVRAILTPGQQAVFDRNVAAPRKR